MIYDFLAIRLWSDIVMYKQCIDFAICLAKLLKICQSSVMKWHAYIAQHFLCCANFTHSIKTLLIRSLSTEVSRQVLAS